MAQNSGFRKIFTSKIFLFALLLIFVWAGIKTVKMIYQKQEIEKEISDLKDQIAKLDKSSQEFSQLMEYLKDPNFLEKEAKEKLNLKKEGENVVMAPEAAVSQILNEPSANPVNGESVSTPPRPESNLILWWRFFFEK